MITHRGFTLLEIVLVTALLGIAAMVVIPTFLSHDDEQKIVLAANEVQDALKYAQSAAQRDNSSKRVDIDTTNDSLSVIDIFSSTLEIHPSSKSPYLLNFLTNSLLSGVDIISVGPSVTGVVSINFQANGQVSAANNIVLSYSTHKKTVHIDDNGRTWVQ